MSFSLLMSLSLAVVAGHGQLVSNPANLSGKEYTNPVIHADYSDPDAVATPDGKTFYMTASSFSDAPGLPILKSNDLVNWTLVNYALDAVPPTEYYDAAPRHGKGVWAPCIRYHDGEYYIYWGDPDFGIYMIKTSDPEGRWSEPLLVKGGRGMIDPSPFWDEDGKAYLSNGWAASRAGFNSILTLSEMTPDGTKVISQPRIIFDGNDGVNHTVEGTKMYRKGDYYYLFAPAGGVATGWQLVMRSKNIYGPYESKIVMTQGDTDINGPHQGAWVSAPDGSDWFLHFQDKAAYGRVIHLNPMTWVDGWPVIGIDKDGDGCGNPVKKYKKPILAKADKSEDTPMLYQWHANYRDMYGFPSDNAMMRLYGHRVSKDFVNMWEVPNLWLQKFPAEQFSMTSKVRISAKSSSEGVSSGIIVMGWDYARLGLEKTGDKFEIQFISCTDAEQGGREVVNDLGSIAPTRTYAAGNYPNLECDIWLRVSVTKGGICTFAYSTDGKKYTVAGKFTARAGKWIGAKIGFYSITPDNIANRGWIDVISSDTVIQ